MTQLKEFYSKKFEEQFNNLQKGMSQISDDALGVAKSFKEVNDSLKTTSKSQEQLNKKTKESEALKKEALKNDNLIIKNQKELEKLQQEAKKSAQQELKTQQEREKLRQQKIRTQKAEQQQNKKTTKTVTNLIQELQKEIKTEREALEQNKKLREARKDLDTSTAKGEKQISLINKRIDQNTDLLKGNADAMTKQKINIGNYASGLDGLDDILGNLSPSLSGATDGVKGLGKQFLKLLANPIVALIAAIVAAITLLIKAFKRSQEGADTFAKAFTKITAAVDAVMGRITALSKAVFKFIKGESSFEELKDQAKDSFKGIRDEINQTIKAADRIFDLKVALEESTIAATSELSKLNQIAEEQAAISDDATRSFQERTKAAEESQKAILKAREIEVQLAKDALNILEQENDLKEQSGALTRELRQQEANLAAALIDAESQLIQARLESTRRRRELAQDDFEQQLDFLLDVADVRKTTNEKIIANDKKTAEERIKTLLSTQAFIEESFEQQVDLFNTVFDVQLDTNKLLKLNNKEAFEYARNLGLSEIATNRLLEVIRERIMATSDLREAQEGLTESLDKQFAEFAKRPEELTMQYREATKEMIAIAEEFDDQPSLLFRLFNPSEEEIEGLKQIAWDLASEIGNGFFEIENAKRENQLILAEDAYSKELVLAGENIIAQRVAERKFAREKAKIAQEQAKADKAQALFNIAINTAQNIVKLAANPILAIAAGVLGATQAAIVAAKPLPVIPAFDKGTKSAPGDGFLAGEKRPEFMIHNGQLSLVDKPTYFGSAYKGATVIGGEQSHMILNQSGNKISDQNIQMMSGFRMIADRISGLKFKVGIDKQGNPYAQMKEHKVKYSKYYN